MTTWLVIIAVGAGSFLMRLGPLLLLQRAELSEQTDRWIRYAGLAAISALIATSTRQAAHGASLLPALLAVGVGVGLAARRASMLRLIGIGGGLYAAATVGVALVR
jgi:branched-subunit amino acid transport protein